MNAHQKLEQLFAHRNPSDVAIELNGFTGWRTTLLEELTEQEAELLLQIHTPKKKDDNALIEELKKREWRSAIISLAELTNIKEHNCYAKFNNWMLTKSTFKKHLNAHSIDELKALHRQLKGIQYNNTQSAKRPMNKAWWDKGEKLKNWN